MSNFTRAAYHPVEKCVRAAAWLDNHFGPHQYGVRFSGRQDEVFKPSEVEVPLDTIFVPRGEAHKIAAGLEAALDYAKVETAIHDWIREDAPLAVKMVASPELVAKLVDRICGSKTTVYAIGANNIPLVDYAADMRNRVLAEIDEQCKAFQQFDTAKT